MFVLFCRRRPAASSQEAENNPAPADYRGCQLYWTFVWTWENPLSDCVMRNGFALCLTLALMEVYNRTCRRGYGTSLVSSQVGNSPKKVTDRIQTFCTLVLSIFIPFLTISSSDFQCPLFCDLFLGTVSVQNGDSTIDLYLHRGSFVISHSKTSWWSYLI